LNIYHFTDVGFAKRTERDGEEQQQQKQQQKPVSQDGDHEIYLYLHRELIEMIIIDYMYISQRNYLSQ